MNDVLFYEQCAMELFASLATIIRAEAKKAGEEISEQAYFGRSIKSILKDANTLLEDARKALRKGNADWEEKYDKALLFLMERNKDLAYGLQNLEARYGRFFAIACEKVDSEEFFQNVGAVELSVGLNPYEYAHLTKEDSIKSVISAYVPM